jgi:hypothetical protein
LRVARFRTVKPLLKVKIAHIATVLKMRCGAYQYYRGRFYHTAARYQRLACHGLHDQRYARLPASGKCPLLPFAYRKIEMGKNGVPVIFYANVKVTEKDIGHAKSALFYRVFVLKHKNNKLQRVRRNISAGFIVLIKQYV